PRRAVTSYRAWLGLTACASVQCGACSSSLGPEDSSRSSSRLRQYSHFGECWRELGEGPRELQVATRHSYLRLAGPPLRRPMYCAVASAQAKAFRSRSMSVMGHRLGNRGTIGAPPRYQGLDRMCAQYRSPEIVQPAQELCTRNEGT